MLKPALKAVAAASLCLGLATAAQAAFVNGSFEDLLLNGAENPGPINNGFVITPQANVNGWRTTAPDGQIEIWRQPGPIAVNAYLGQQFAELNANLVGGLYQDVVGIAAGSIVGWELAHRGRTGLDTMQLIITDLGADNALGGVGGDMDVDLFNQQFSTGQDWRFYFGSGLMALGNTVRFEFRAVSTANGDISTGNFLDATNFGVGVGQVPEPMSLLLAGTALLGVGAARRLAKKNS